MHIIDCAYIETIPGIGLITAAALAVRVPDPTVFKSGQQFAAYLDLVLGQNPLGGKDRLDHLSKTGNSYLRWLIIIGATSVTRWAPTTYILTDTCLRPFLERKPPQVVAVAIANKTARTA